MGTIDRQRLSLPPHGAPEPPTTPEFPALRIAAAPRQRRPFFTRKFGRDGAPARWRVRIFRAVPLPALLAALHLLLAPPLGAQDFPFPSEPPPPVTIGRLYRTGVNHLRNERPEQAREVWEDLLRRSPYHFNAHLALGRLLIDRDPDAAGRHLNVARDLRPASDAVRYHLGRYLESQQRLLDAAEEFRQAIRLNARHYAANTRLRQIIRALRRRQSVVERAAESFWSNPSLATLTLFGKIVMQNSAPRQALMEFELVRQRAPGLPEANLWVARAQRQLGSLQGEIAAYRAYLATDEDAVGVRLLMLDRLLEAGEFRRAGAPLRQLEERLEQRRMGKQEMGRLLFLKSRFLVARGKPVQAGANLLASASHGFDAAEIDSAFRKVVALYPQQARLWMNFGGWLVQDGRHDAAVESYLKAAKLDQGVGGEAAGILRETAGESGSTSPGAISANLALGELALAQGDEIGAIVRLERVPPGHRTDARAALLLGVVYRNQGELDKSLDAFTRYVFSFPDRGGMAFARGNLFWMMGRKDVAMGLWNRDLATLDDYPEALQLMAVHYQAGGDGEQELKIRRHLRGAAPENLANRIRLGDLLLERGEGAAAADEWEQVVRFKTADFDLLVRLGNAYLERGERDRGVSALHRAAQIGTLQPEVSEKLARQLLAGERWPEALEFYWQIYRTQPDHPDLADALPKLVMNAPALPEQRLAAARYAEAGQRPELAIDLLEDLLRLHPETGEGRVMLARLYMAAGEPGEAERTLFEGGEELQVSEAESLHALATVQQHLGKREDLARTLDRIIILEPGDTAVARRLGLLLMQLKRINTARGLLEKTLAARPDDAEVLFQLATAEFTLKQLPRAEAYLSRLFEAQAGHEGGRELQRQILQRERRWEELARELETFVAAHPDNATARSDLVSAYLNLFEIEKARPHYQVLRKSNTRKARALQRYFRQ